MKKDWWHNWRSTSLVFLVVIFHIIIDVGRRLAISFLLGALIRGILSCIDRSQLGELQKMLFSALIVIISLLVFSSLMDYWAVYVH
ncbi:hypothetical protein [Candidatus Liberibacter brunswickensis]|uniref:hypothetical protein n=1 Tax=Candidatus Liberibacter brunswickensis TaxID=1968796 RepID=UPI002FE14EC9